MPSTRYEVYRAAERDGTDVKTVWRWRGVAADNGEILSSGQAYSRRIDAIRLIETRFLRDGDEIVQLEDLHQAKADDWNSENYQFALLHDAVGEPEDDDAKGLDCG